MRKTSILILFAAVASSFAWDADVIGTLKEKVNAYNAAFKRKKIDLLFDQPKYTAGDTALLRVLYVDAAKRLPVDGREIVYIELFDAAGKSVLRDKIAVEKGWASNRLVFPSSMTPGFYQVVAWSDWMRNMDASLFFRQEIVIAGPKLIRKSFLANEGKLDFFPEGGNLIAGVKNNIIIHYNGNPSDKSVTVVGSTVATASFDQNGLAEVSLVPENGSSINASVSGSESRRFALPQPQADGFVMHVTASSGNAMGLHVEAAGAAINDRAEYFVVYTNNEGIVFYDRLSLDASHAANVSVPVSLSPGVVLISIVDSNLKVWANRSIFIQSHADISANVNPISKVFNTRSQATANIEVRSNRGAVVGGNFSVRILNESVFSDSIPYAHSVNNLMLYSDLSSTFRINTNVGNTETLRYLATQTCPWLPWDKVISGNNKPEFKSISNPSLSGTVINIETGKPVQDSTEITFFVEKQMIGYEELITDNGKFDFPLLFDFYGPDEIFYAATRKNRDVKNVRVVLNKQLQDSTFSFPASASKAIEREDPYGKYKFQKDVIDRSFTFYSNRSNTRDSVIDKNIYFEKELQGADITFRTTDYVLFPNMTELVREVLKAVDYRKMKGQDVVRVYTTNRQLPTAYVTPLFVIDGVFTKNPTTFMNLVPSDIITIKIIRNSNKLTKLGDLGAHGVIMVWTKKQTASENLRPENVFPVTGVSVPINSKKITEPKINNQIPDLRPVLEWYENVPLNDGSAKIRFATGDDTGKYKIVIDGMTSDGTPFFSEETITVKYDAQP